MTGPYISIVLVGRNDNYGVNFLSRLNTCIKSLDYQTQNYSELFELVVVEWNPLPNYPSLKNVIYKPKNLSLRIITVPDNVHNMLHTAYPVLEFYGKNVGIRRSNGEFVLVTNPDIIFSNELIQELASKTLVKNILYRTDRYDFKADGIENLHPKEFLDFAVKNTFVGHIIAGGSYAVPINGVAKIENLPTSDPNTYHTHTNGCGDFILASKEVFFKANGLWETTHQKWHLDSYSLHKLRAFCSEQKLFLSPNCIFHMDHPRKPQDVPYDYNFAVRVMHNPNLLVSDTQDNWGLQGLELSEYSVVSTENIKE